MTSAKHAKFTTRTWWLPTTAVVALIMTTMSVATPVPAYASVLPANNLIANPSFESGTAGWSSPNSTTIGNPVVSGAPHGTHVASIAWAGTSNYVALDNYPGPVTSTVVGTSYTASAWVEAPSGSAEVGHSLQLNLREQKPDGSDVQYWTSTITLTTSFQQISVVGHARAPGDHLDVYIADTSPTLNAPIYADAFSLIATAMPNGNLLTNPSFEMGQSGWSAGSGPTAGNASFSVATTTNAPDGINVAQLTSNASGSWMSLGQWPSATISSGGQTYEGQAFVAAGNTGTTGKTAQLVLREDDANGNYVDMWTTTATLTSNWQQLVVDAKVHNAGDHLSIYVAELSPAVGDALNLDAFGLVPTAPTIAELALNYDQNAPQSNGSSPLGDTSKYAYVITQQPYGATIWNPGGQTELDAIRATNPHPQVFSYINVATTKYRTDCTANDANLPYLAYNSNQSDSTQSYSKIINYCWLSLHNHLNWLLQRSDCSNATYSDYADSIALDVTNASVRSQMAQDAATAAVSVGSSAAPYDGLYLDDVNTDPGHGLNGNVGHCTNGVWTQIADSAYGAGMATAIAAIKSAVNRPLLANVGVNPWGAWSAEQQDVATIAAAATINREFFTQWIGTGSEGECGPDFSQMDEYVLQKMQSYVSDNQTLRGTKVTTLDYGPTAGLSTNYDATAQEIMRTTRASFLLSWDGTSGSATMYRPCTGDPAPAYTGTNMGNAQWTDDLGLPTGPAEVVATGTNSDSEQAQALLRPYTKGYVLFNDIQSPVTVKLSGSFRGSDGTIYNGSITIQGQSSTNEARGLLLTRISY